MRIRVILMLSWLWLGVSDGSCPALYRRYSKAHTYCLPPKSSSTILKSGISKSDIETIVRVHNELRSKVATGEETTYSMPKASNMRQMVWDSELAAVAQKHANQCLFKHDCNNCRKVKNFDVGQNLFKRNPFSVPPQPTWAQAVTDWYSEVNVFDQGQIDGFIDGEGPPQTGHFTQDIWAESWRVGCGYSVCEEGNVLLELYTCNYGPAGNGENDPIYERGDPCTNCPLNSCCGSSCSGGTSYPGLCRISGENAPQYNRPEGLTFYCSFNNEHDCAKTVTGHNKWQVSKTLSGSYIGIVLNGGESSTLSFKNPAKVPQKPLCFIINYRTGPQVDGEEVSGTANVIFKAGGSTFPSELNSNGFQSFTKFSITLGWNMPTMIDISISVPEGGSSRYLEIKDMSAHQGKC